MINILFIGLSNKVDTKPLESSTLSGALIDKIINNLNHQCIKANLVDFTPLGQNGKIRYPDTEEMNKGFESLRLVLEKNKPYIAVCLGKKVSDYLNNKVENSLSIRHPAYIAVYKRKEMDLYIKNTVNDINSMVLKNSSKKLL